VQSAATTSGTVACAPGLKACCACFTVGNLHRLQSDAFSFQLAPVYNTSDFLRRASSPRPIHVANSSMPQSRQPRERDGTTM
jgi:hypothetical protein